MIERRTNLHRAHFFFGAMVLLQVGCDHGSTSNAGNDAPPSPSVTSVATPPSAKPTASAMAKGNDDPLSELSNGPVVRDDEDVTIDGVPENWRLEWARPAIPDCIGDGWESCACAGFAFGEKGDLDLVRTRGGKEVERMRLDPLFENNDARIARWPVTNADQGKKPAIADIAMRPVKDVIKFADYDHDGRATEFLLQVGAGPCGHVSLIVVGISKSNPKLHAFTSIEKPDQPLSLDRMSDWEKVVKQPAVDIVQIACGDHGATESTTLQIKSDGNFHVKSDSKKCP